MAGVAALILTASGGPFLDATAAEMAAVTPAQALRHPTWTMGAKITIDSATLANKGLEVIEAHWLYDVDYDAIEVVIHPQSVVHSAVRFVDGSLKAQLGTPDMRLPIQYALTYPDRRPSPAAAADLVAAGRLDFRAPDETRFPALRIAREAGRLGPRASAALIAADEVAVARFLDGTPRLPGHPAPARGRRDAVRQRTGGDAPTSTSSSPSTRDVRDAFATDPLRSSRVTGFFQSIITIVLFILILGALVIIHELGHFVTARAVQRPGPRVRHRLPAAGQGPAQQGRDRLHPQLAADRRLREARGRGRRPTPTIRARSRTRACPRSSRSSSPAWS